ncbi:MAG TPA: hypothetical protein DCE18_14285 [Syntrophobacteraceae bacterium]|jgi:hypothetical protein|nr:hypothetical protein [Syntrophobacteraceae bacterium]
MEFRATAAMIWMVLKAAVGWDDDAYCSSTSAMAYPMGTRSRPSAPGLQSPPSFPFEKGGHGKSRGPGM